MMTPLPLVNQAYAMIISDESQKAMSSSSSVRLLGAMPAIHAHDPTAMYSKTAASKFRKNYNLFCEFCKLKGHTKDTCYKLVGYPTDSRFKKKGGVGASNYRSSSGSFGPSAHNVLSKRVKEGYVTEAQDGKPQGMNMVQTGACTFTQICQDAINKIVKVIRTDNGSEFVNDSCTSLFTKLGIIHQRSCPYTPQQNGIAERKHRHILEVTRAIRLQSHIPLRFWGHCVQAVVYLINRMHSAVPNMSPYQKLHNRSPSLNHLRVLGCLCYAKNVVEHDKMESRVRTAVLMGYSETQKGYILYDLTNNSFFVNRDTTFQEYEFPFHKTSSVQELPSRCHHFQSMLGSLEFELGWTAIPKALLYADGFPVAKDLSHCLYTSFNVHPTLLKLVVWLAFHLMVSRLRWMWLVTTNKTQFIMDTFNSLGYKVYGGKNEPYMCVCFPGRSSWGVFCEILEKAHVVTTPGCDFGPGGEGFVRVSALGHGGTS
ncbi:hypothetical protein FXO38_19192 [Capsicum annuum]|nr:hypothetical protein FXO38_19192 [Capsicum annuum]